jgi:hypothetical protein
VAAGSDGAADGDGNLGLDNGPDAGDALDDDDDDDTRRFDRAGSHAAGSIAGR